MPFGATWTSYGSAVPRTDGPESLAGGAEVADSLCNRFDDVDRAVGGDVDAARLADGDQRRDDPVVDSKNTIVPRVAHQHRPVGGDRDPVRTGELGRDRRLLTQLERVCLRGVEDGAVCSDRNGPDVVTCPRDRLAISHEQMPVGDVELPRPVRAQRRRALPVRRRRRLTSPVAGRTRSTLPAPFSTTRSDPSDWRSMDVGQTNLSGGRFVVMWLTRASEARACAAHATATSAPQAIAIRCGAAGPTLPHAMHCEFRRGRLVRRRGGRGARGTASS